MSDEDVPLPETPNSEPHHVIRQEIKTSEVKYSDLPMEEHWFKSYWRPAVAWTYLATVAYDFLFAPISHNLYEGFTHVSLSQYAPITLQGGGLYHLAMGAIIGIYAWNRTKEKMNGVDTKPD